jgi:hypothetical protein
MSLRMRNNLLDVDKNMPSDSGYLPIGAGKYAVLVGIPSATPIGVAERHQRVGRELMRRAQVSTTMNVYGNALMHTPFQIPAIGRVLDPRRDVAA